MHEKEIGTVVTMIRAQDQRSYDEDPDKATFVASTPLKRADQMSKCDVSKTCMSCTYEGIQDDGLVGAGVGIVTLELEPNATHLPHWHRGFELLFIINVRSS